jgi:hypothetical protein
MKGIADRVSQVAAIGISGLLTLALFVGGGVLEPWSGRRARGGWLGTFLGGAAWVGACFGLWSGLSGGSVASLRTSLQRRLSRRIEGLLLRLVE